MKSPDPRVVVPNTSVRDAILAIVAGLLVLAFVLYGIFTMAKPGTGNRLTGVVVAKHFTPQPEQQITFSGRKLEGAKEIDGEYLLEVRVEEEKRTFQVPVEKPLYESRKVGDSLTFVRPPSEQK
jgi:hypothetical protein